MFCRIGCLGSLKWVDEEGMEEMQEEDEFIADIKERLSNPENQEKWITLVDFHY